MVVLGECRALTILCVAITTALSKDSHWGSEIAVLILTIADSKVFRAELYAPNVSAQGRAVGVRSKVIKKKHQATRAGSGASRS